MTLLDREVSSRHERDDRSQHLEQQAPAVATRSPSAQHALRGDRRRVAPFVPVDFGTSPAMRRVLKLVEHSAASDLPVLITGEVGVGKDLIAREIHRRSSRAEHPLLEVHCASVASGYFESETLAAGGSMFLDDIGELTTELQGQLLDRLRRADAAPSNGAAKRPVELRLIASAQHDIANAVKAGTFSESLYYRINVIHIEVPPLRARPEDVPALVRHFARKHESHDDFPAALLARFRTYDWPGNVRELENAVLRFIALGDPAYVLDELRAKPLQCAHCSPGAEAASHPPPDGAEPRRSSEAPGRDVDLKEVGRKASASAERDVIVDMLRQTLGNKKKAAKSLGISYKALLYKIHDFGIAKSRSAPRHAAPDATASTSS